MLGWEREKRGGKRKRDGGIVAKEFLIRLEIEINSRQKFELPSRLQ